MVEARVVADNIRSNATPCVAILRIDDFQDPSVAIVNRVTVVRVMLNASAAEAEIRRLKALNGDKGCRYVLQSTRLEGTNS
jgi:hypothetical protein